MLYVEPVLHFGPALERHVRLEVGAIRARRRVANHRRVVVQRVHEIGRRGRPDRHKQRVCPAPSHNYALVQYYSSFSKSYTNTRMDITTYEMFSCKAPHRINNQSIRLVAFELLLISSPYKVQ